MRNSSEYNQFKGLCYVDKIVCGILFSHLASSSMMAIRTYHKEAKKKYSY